ncbi:hypothetical protein RchiOBHm_Chr2g0099431 [Rosa chinensis]|uniref:Uncharacterized protein n=1 Tax=Rosa chinensis TaxID=74649 RepID=A0A2P6RLX1_ROSCH|nr:hypothetical protein RchiOBHm_Chr2g0099431 [Rosa chinensis]
MNSIFSSSLSRAKKSSAESAIRIFNAMIRFVVERFNFKSSSHNSSFLARTSSFLLPFGCKYSTRRWICSFEVCITSLNVAANLSKPRTMLSSSPLFLLLLVFVDSDLEVDSDLAVDS